MSFLNRKTVKPFRHAGFNAGMDVKPLPVLNANP
jgi:hypothetical protein